MMDEIAVRHGIGMASAASSLQCGNRQFDAHVIRASRCQKRGGIREVTLAVPKCF